MGDSQRAPVDAVEATWLLVFANPDPLHTHPDLGELLHDELTSRVGRGIYARSSDAQARSLGELQEADKHDESLTLIREIVPGLEHLNRRFRFEVASELSVRSHEISEAIGGCPIKMGPHPVGSWIDADLAEPAITLAHADQAEVQERYSSLDILRVLTRSRADALLLSSVPGRHPSAVGDWARGDRLIAMAARSAEPLPEATCLRTAVLDMAAELAAHQVELADATKTAEGQETE